MKRARTANPYRDTDVIDARAPRFNQAVIGSLSLVAVLVDWWPLFAILAGQLVIGLLFGRRFCLPCLADLVVQFTHPLCTDCQELERRLVAEGRRVVAVDVSRQPDLARKYGVAIVPTAFAVGADGTVAARLAG